MSKSYETCYDFSIFVLKSTDYVSLLGMKKYDDITPAPLIDQSLIGNIVFSVPIAIIVTNNERDMEQIDSLSMTLESLIKQPGINPANIYVYYNGAVPLVLEMAKLFKFHSISVDIGPYDGYTDVTCAYQFKLTITLVESAGNSTLIQFFKFFFI